MMRKEEFLARLETLLSDISEEERKEAMAFYRSYFEDAGEVNEAQIIGELGAPENVAETIMRDLGMITVPVQERTDEKQGDFYEQGTPSDGTYYKWEERRQSNPYGNYEEYGTNGTNAAKKNSWLVPFLIVIAVFTFPVWFGMLMSVIGTIFGLSVALVAITFAMFVVGAVLVGLGIVMITGLSVAVVSVPAGLAFVGAGLLVLAFALLLLLACVAVFGTFLPWTFKGIYNLCKKPFANKEAQTI